MKYVGPTRKKIGKRTIFNMIGPLSSPANVERQVVGVFEKKLLDIFADALKDLKIKFAWIVNSNDGLDEISPYDKTIVKQLRNGEINEMIIDPKELKVNADGFVKIVGNDSKFNSQKIIDIFKKGCNKAQILNEFTSTDRIKFYGDRTDPAGNDYPLAVRLKAHQVYAVEDWKHTMRLLANE